jgi:hypothetical protein
MGPCRFLCWTTAACLTFSAVSGLSAQPGPVVRCDALVGFNGTAREDRFAPVILSVENPGARMQAEISLQVTWGSTFGGLPAVRTIVREAVLDAGSTRRFPFVIPVPRDVRTLHASVVSQGAVAGSLDVELRPLTTTSRIVAAVSSDLSLDGLAALGGAGTLRVVYPRVDDLPASWAGYDAVDAVIVHDTAFQQLRSDQVTALERWVVTGGVLVFTGGAAALQHEPSGFGRLLPVEISGLTQKTGMPFLPGSARGPAGPVEIAASRVQKGKVVAGDETLPLVVLRRLGRGSVWFLAFDPTLPPVSTWSGALPMWRYILGGDRVPAMGAAPREPLADPWIGALLSSSPVSFPPIPALLVFAACYLALLAPLLTGRPARGMKPRLRLILMAAVSISATFAGWAVFSRVLFRPGLQVMDVARVEGRSGDGLAVVTEKIALFASSALPAEVRLASAAAAVEAAGQAGGQAGSQAGGQAGSQSGGARYTASEPPLLLSEKGGRTTITGVDVGRYEARLLVVQDVVPLGVILRADIRGSAVSATVTNGTDQALKGCFLLDAGNAYSLGEIAPGATVSRTFDSAASVIPEAEIADPRSPFLQGDTRRAGFWKAAAVEATAGNAAARLVAWMDGPVLPFSFPRGVSFGGRVGIALLSVEAE